MRLVDADRLLKGKEDHDMISTHVIWNAPTIDAIPVEYIRDYANVLRNSADRLDNHEERELADIFIYGSDAINSMLIQWEKEKNKNE